MENENGRTNHGQFIPYPSKDMKIHADLYNRLKLVFADLFIWIDKIVSIYPHIIAYILTII